MSKFKSIIQDVVKLNELKMSDKLSEAIIVFILIILVCREIVCWYWKINQSLSEYSKINNNLKELNQNLLLLLEKKKNPDEESLKVETNSNQNTQMGICPQCRVEIPKNSERCQFCNALFVGKHAKWKPIQ
jgi:hypothetical protein